MFSESHPTASTSQEHSKILNVGRPDVKEKENRIKKLIFVDFEKYFKREDKLQCEGCNEWYHCVCGDIENDEIRECLQNVATDWICPICKKRN